MKRTLLFIVAAGTAAVWITAHAQQATPKVRTLTEQEVADLLVGSSIQGTRNGDSGRMIQTAKNLMAQGKKFTMVSPDDIPDDWMVVAAAGGVGGGGAWEYVTERVKKQNLPTVQNATVEAARVLSKHMGKTFSAIIRNEADGAMISAFQSAIELGVPVVDACLAGLGAKPELNLQVSFANGISGTPAALVTRWGDVVILDKTVDDYRLEDLARAVAVASGGGSSIARNPMTGRDVKRGTIKGALTEAMLFGRTVREARAQGKDPIEALIAVANRSRPTFRMFQGTVTKSDQKGERGFNWVDAEISGTGQFAGHTYKVYVKNENIISWLDGKPDILPPDLIFNLDPVTGDAVTNVVMGNYPISKEVVIVGRAASPMWRTPKGLEIFSPKHFGFDVEYRPIEELQKMRPKFTSN